MFAQEAQAGGTGGVGWLSGKEDKLRARLGRYLLAAPTRDFAAGWGLAADLGQPAVPLLWELQAEERSNLARRLAVLAAAVIAGGPNEDERLFAWLAQARPMLEERCLAAMLLALGPTRTRAQPEFWSRLQGPSKSSEQILSIAVRLASARFPGAEADGPAFVGDDPGVAAASAFASLPVPGSLAGSLWNMRSGARHAELFWRGALLGVARRPVPAPQAAGELLARAREVGQMGGPEFASARNAAIVCRSHLQDVRAEGPRLEWQLLHLAASDVGSAENLRPWLAAAPSPRDEQQPRLAVAYVLSRRTEEVVQERAVWAADPRVARHVAVALAWRLAGRGEATALPAAPAGLPEWIFVQWAARAPVPATAGIEDPVLASAARLAAAGRLPAEAGRQALEDTLWRWGSHPGLGRWEQERLLVRDLLLVGSHQGGSKYVPHVRPELRYRPAGMGPDSPFFDVAVPLFDFLWQPTLPIPAEHRLR